eukprot:2699920-Prymnesium_polylepis.1
MAFGTLLNRTARGFRSMAFGTLLYRTAWVSGPWHSAGVESDRERVGLVAAYAVGARARERCADGEGAVPREGVLDGGEDLEQQRELKRQGRGSSCVGEHSGREGARAGEQSSEEETRAGSTAVRKLVWVSTAVGRELAR